MPRPEPRPAPRPSGTIGVTPTVLEGVSFFIGSARLRSESFVTLDSIAVILLADTTLRVEIGGHTDNIGEPAEAQRLTTLQAEAVRMYLVQKGVPAQQIIAARGYGAAVPLTTDNSPRGRARNRRIEIRRVPAGP
jgi:OOP family OmpA-OmpF porin